MPKVFFGVLNNMLKIHSEPPKPSLPTTGPAIFALGFRPFFAAAGLSGLILLGIWLLAWGGAMDLSPYYGVIGWHSHEMLFGYSTAVIAGFLLTAVRNWTGINTPTGKPLILLSLLWLAGRIAPFASGLLPDPVIAAVDLAFLPALAMAIRRPLWQGQQRINRIFVPLLLTMALANLLVHLQSLGLADTAARGTDTMLYLIVLLVIIVSGRILPFFTRAVVPGYTPQSLPWVESATLIFMAGLILTQLIYPAPWLTGPLAAAAAVTQIVRILGWHHRSVWSLPILWILYSAYFWVIAGFVMLALSSTDLLAMSLAKHALTVGGVGLMTFGMMARVSLGHTGRPIEPARLIVLAFVLLNLAAALRVLGPLVLPQYYPLWIQLSGGLWMLCFLAFSIVYLPILFRARIDGKAG